MDPKYMRMLRIVAAICVMIAATIRFSLPPTAVSAQSTPVSIYSENSHGSSGEVLLDEGTGALTFCAEAVEFSGLGEPIGVSPVGSCKLLGLVTPGVGNSSLNEFESGASLFFLNNQTGEITQCSAGSILSGVGEPVGVAPLGVCVGRGNAYQ
jgi:hypothetical protein